MISVNLQDLQTKTSSLKNVLAKSLRRLLKANGVRYLFPVQAAVIPFLIRGYRHRDVVYPRDICVSAPTGSGKTLAFVLPVIQALTSTRTTNNKRIRALVVLPTQDLAAQVHKTFRLYAVGSGLDVALITGNVPFAVEQKQLVTPDSK